MHATRLSAWPTGELQQGGAAGMGGHWIDCLLPPKSPFPSEGCPSVLVSDPDPSACPKPSEPRTNPICLLQHLKGRITGAGRARGPPPQVVRDGCSERQDGC